LGRPLPLADVVAAAASQLPHLHIVHCLPPGGTSAVRRTEAEKSGAKKHSKESSGAWVAPRGWVAEVAANIAAVVVVAHTAAGAAGAAEEVEDMKGSWTSGVVLLKKPLEVVGGRPFLAVVVKEAPDRRTWSESGAQTWEEEGSCAGLVSYTSC